jgi:DNA-binding NarL/FixJ family response regulator
VTKTPSPREREVLELIRQGYPNKVIAHVLGMCEPTVKIHVRNLLMKAGCSNRTQLAVSQLFHAPTPPEDDDNGSSALATG